MPVITGVGLLSSMIKHYMGKPQTTARALLLLLSLAKIAGHMNVKLVSHYRKLAKVWAEPCCSALSARHMSSSCRSNCVSVVRPRCRNPLSTDDANDGCEEEGNADGSKPLEVLVDNGKDAANGSLAVEAAG